MATPENLKYTDSHEWVREEADGTVTIGITAASGGDAPFVLLPVVLGFIDSILFFAMPRPDFAEKYNKPALPNQYRRDWERP